MKQWCFCMSDTYSLSVQPTVNYIPVIAGVAEAFQSFNSAHGANLIIKTVQHQSIEPVTRFKGAHPVKYTAAALSAHIKGLGEAELFISG